jgi:hypothetical protein
MTLTVTVESSCPPASPGTPNALPHRIWLTWCCYLAGMSTKQTSTSIYAGTETIRTNIQEAKRKLRIPPGTNRVKCATYPFARTPPKRG